MKIIYDAEIEEISVSLENLFSIPQNNLNYYIGEFLFTLKQLPNNLLYELNISTGLVQGFAKLQNGEPDRQNPIINFIMEFP